MQPWPYSLKSKFQNRQICQRHLEKFGIVYTASDASGAIGASGGSNSQSHDNKAPRKGAEDDDSEETWGNWGKEEHRGVKRRYKDT